MRLFLINKIPYIPSIADVVPFILMKKREKDNIYYFLILCFVLSTCSNNVTPVEAIVYITYID